ncbi:MAG: AhpC/TSA family protein [Betaproteobacteria bacterium]|nr:MAG: AhpC/TSA family protein [Betaproteobacteria bacterium]
MTLKDELQQHLAKFKQDKSPEVIATIQADIDALIASDFAGSAVKEGDKAPDFELPGVHGNPVRLSSLLERGPVVLTFYRGGWCPYCNLQLRAYQRILPEIRALGAQLVAISPESPDASLTTAEKNELEFEVLSDANVDVARAYRILFDLSEQLQKTYVGMGRDLTELNADGEWHLPIPATYVIAPDGRVVLSHVDVEYRNRLEPNDILAALQRLRAPAEQTS